MLVVEAQLSAPPRPEAAMPWQPIEVARNGALSLIRVPMRRAVVQVFGEAPVILGVGWEGTDERTRTTLVPVRPTAIPDLRDALSVHPPWYEGLAGAVVLEYPLRLPPDLPISLRFANAIRGHYAGEPPSDGVTFRVRAVPWEAPDGALGDVLFELHTDAKTWQDAEVDLGRFAGQAIRLQFESHPGPKNDTTCDRALWAEPTVVAGTPASPEPREEHREKFLGAVANDNFFYDVHVRLGSRGLLDGEVRFSGDGKRLSFEGFRVCVLGDALEDPGAPSALVEVVDESKEDVCRVRHRFETWRGAFDLVGELFVDEGRALRAQFRLENTPPPRPWSVVYIEDLSAGPWSEEATHVYAGAGNVMRNPRAFTLGFDGHRLSTSFVGFDFEGGLSLVQALDVPPGRLHVVPEGRLYTLGAPLDQTVTFIPSQNVWDSVRVWRAINGLAPAGGVERLAGRFVFDLWGGHYGSSREALERAFRYGLTDSAVVWHNWQRWGYDYRLPEIYPPNPNFGTLAEFQALSHTCKEHDVLFAPHDNYIDFYPDAEGFSYEHIEFNHHGDPIRAWLNEGRQAQSYRWRPDALRPFLERNLGLVREHIAPTAYFIDVWSSIGPYGSWTIDGQFQDRVLKRSAWGEAFAWIRDYLGDNAPQISESGHDQLIGYLDGAQTNHLRVGRSIKGSEWMVWPIECEDAERIPWFDTAHHDRFVLHGAGYGSRYCGGLEARLHGIYSDDYITTEVLTGHPAMVPGPFGRDVVRKYWLLHALMRALALKRIETVEFAGGDDSAVGDLHRQHVRWQDRGEVWVNRGDADWAVQGHTLPPYGFYAAVDAVKAAIERKDGVIVEWSDSPEGLYVNARPVVSDVLPVSVALDELRYLGEREFEAAFRWDAEEALADPLRVFVHFVNEGGDIVFQADHDAATPTTQWQGVVRTLGRAEIPGEFRPDDAVELRLGLYYPGGRRMRLRGVMDGETRIRLGTVRFEGEGDLITSLAFEALPDQPDPLLARMNPEGKAIAFGPVTTDGACKVDFAGGAITVTPLPGSPEFTVVLEVQAQRSYHARALAEDGALLATAQLRKEGNALALTCEPGVFSYRLASPQTSP